MPRQDVFFHGWRVEDNDSKAQFKKSKGGIVASSKRSVPMNAGCRKIIRGHLNWHSRNLSPCISATVDREWAFNEARRRKRQGKTNVVVHEICISKSRLRGYERRGNRIVYRHVFKWLDLARTKLPGCADFACTEQEYLFLHSIPAAFIVRTSKI